MKITINTFILILLVILILFFPSFLACFYFSIKILTYLIGNDQNNLIVSIASAIATSVSATATSAAAIIALVAYKKQVNDEKPRSSSMTLIKRHKHRQNEYEIEISLLNESSLPTSYALRGFIFTKNKNISDEEMRHTITSQSVLIKDKDSIPIQPLTYKYSFNFLNINRINEFVNVGSRESVSIATLYVDLNYPNEIPVDRNYIQIIIKDFRKDNFNVPIKISDINI